VGNIYYGRHGKNLAEVAPTADSQRSRCPEPILWLRSGWQFQTSPELLRIGVAMTLPSKVEAVFV